MSKKKPIIFIVFMLFIIVSFIQAQGFSLSAGGGLNLGVTFSNWRAFRSGNVGTDKEFGIGAFAFFDATYVELNGGYKFEIIRGTYGSEGSRTSLNFGVLGKLPFAIGRIDLYPLLGAQYRIVNYLEYGGTVYNDLSIRDALWIMAGGGCDFFLSRSFFLRTQFLYGYMFKTSQQKSQEGNYDYLTHGTNIKIALGYQFFNSYNGD